MPDLPVSCAVGDHPESFVLLPAAVQARLTALDCELNDGDITLKGYVKKAHQLMEAYLPTIVTQKISDLKIGFQDGNIPEKDYYASMKDFLKVKLLKEETEKNGEPNGEQKAINGNHVSNGTVPVENMKVEDGQISELKNGITSKADDKTVRDEDDELSESEIKSKECDKLNKCAGKADHNAKAFDSKKTTSNKDMDTESSEKEMDTINDTEPDSTEKVSPKRRSCKLKSPSATTSDSTVNSSHRLRQCTIRKVPDTKQATIESMFSKVNKRKSNSSPNNSVEPNKRKISAEHAMSSSSAKDVKVVSVEEDLDEKSAEKRQRVKEKSTKPRGKIAKTPTSENPRCTVCRQMLNDPDLRIFGGHPDGALDEDIALTDPRLILFTGDEDGMMNDERPQHKILSFSVYDREGHLCPFDSGLIESNVYLYFSGYMKPIYDETPGIEGGIPTKELGPINEWWIAGFDGGERELFGFSTQFGDYYMIEPSEEYAPLISTAKEKIYLSKVVIEFLAYNEDATYEDLINQLQTVVPLTGYQRQTEDDLLRHAQFVCDQVQSFDSAASETERLLITSPCMRSLINLSGITLGKRRAMRRAVRKDIHVKTAVWSKATTTSLVGDVFETLFSNQLDNQGADDEKKQGPRRRRCGICEVCQLPDCGTCNHCQDMTKFGGSGKSKQACVTRRCPNLAVQEADDSEDEDADELDSKVVARPTHKGIKATKAKVEWNGEPISTEGERVYYNSVFVNKEEISVGECVMVQPDDSAIPIFIAKVVYMWDDPFDGKVFHAQWFCRATDSVLGETADPSELFLVDECEDSKIAAIKYKADVTFTKIPDNWFKMGGTSLEKKPASDNDNGKKFSCQKWYSSQYGRFEDIPKDPEITNSNIKHRYCGCCERLHLLQKSETPTVVDKLKEGAKGEVIYGKLLFNNMEFMAGDCIFLDTEAFNFKVKLPAPQTSSKQSKKDIDENIYTEYYRKTFENAKGSNLNTPEPFRIGRIESIVAGNMFGNLVDPNDIRLRITKFYRPENTHLGTKASEQSDMNLLYWSEEEATVKFSHVKGKCFVVYRENITTSIDVWSKGGPYRYYFTESYSYENKGFDEPPSKAQNMGMVGKGKGVGKSSAKGKNSSSHHEVKIEDYPNISRRLRSLDVFAGCGGLSEGLHQAGLCETKWAIEKEETAAQAFKLNNPNCTVFSDDCNNFLKLVMDGETKNEKGQKLPQKGDVEFLCGGPPCQGFSGMNRFNSRQYSLFKNSLIVSYLSFCDYYRPRFFILENVRNFVSFKRSMVLKLALSCLVRMGYQCAFSIVQAGNFGVPQTRRRAIIIAAAPGEILPKYPEPLHCFSPRACVLAVVVDDKKYDSGCTWTNTAPYRNVTVRDSMFDLPAVKCGHKKEEIAYGGDPISHFQRKIRGATNTVLRDHITKDMSTLQETRISYIPTAPGSDWRDLPNIIVRLTDGAYTKKLIYAHHDKRAGKSSSGALRGVCQCVVTGKSCDPMDRQFNTLIPWCLPHTGNRHNHWAGLYGRLEWDGYFSTTITNPEPLGKQGLVLHPDQHRVVSVRECARSQGFPDTYKFYGTILDKHRQVGNAVPPPMGCAIGREIVKSIYQREQEDNMET